MAFTQPGEESGREASSAGGGSSDLIPHLWKFRVQYRDGKDADKLLRAALKLGMDLFGAGEGAVAVDRARGRAAADPPLHAGGLPLGSADARAASCGARRSACPPELMLARIRRHGRMWGALAVRSAGKAFHWDSRQAFSSIGSLANELIDEIDRERIREVRAGSTARSWSRAIPSTCLTSCCTGSAR